MTEAMIDPRMVDAVRTSTLLTPAYRIQLIRMHKFPYGRFEYFYHGRPIIWY